MTPTPAAIELPSSLWTALTREVAAFPGAFAENKRFSFVVHYRLAPAAEQPLRQAVTRLIGSSPDRGRSHGCALRDRAQGSRPRQGPRHCGVSGCNRRSAAGRRSLSATTRPTKAGSPSSPRTAASPIRSAGGGRGATGLFADPRGGPRLAGRIRPSRRRAHDGASANQEPEPRSGADRQLLHRRPRRPQRPHRLVVFPLLRFRSGVLATARRRRGERASAKSRSPTSPRPNCATCATPRSSRRS